MVNEGEMYANNEIMYVSILSYRGIRSLQLIVLNFADHPLHIGSQFLNKLELLGQ